MFFDSLNFIVSTSFIMTQIVRQIYNCLFFFLSRCVCVVITCSFVTCCPHLCTVRSCPLHASYALNYRFKQCHIRTCSSLCIVSDARPCTSHFSIIYHKTLGKWVNWDWYNTWVNGYMHVCWIYCYCTIINLILILKRKLIFESIWPISLTP